MTRASQLRAFGFIRLWHVANHRKLWGGSHNWFAEKLLKEARECFRRAKEAGARLP